MRIGLLLRHLKDVRIPLLIAVAGAVLTLWVDQIRELFFLLAAAHGELDVKLGAASTTTLLGVAVWHSARTVFRVRVAAMPALQDPAGAGLRTWLPRLLGASVPLLMFAGVYAALHDPGLREDRSEVSWAMPVTFALISAGLLALFIVRRRLGRRLGIRWEADPVDDPVVSRWSELPPSVRWIYRALTLANVAALALAAWRPGVIGHVGPLGIILLTASFLTITGTRVTIQSAVWDVPLFGVLALLAIAWHWLGYNDNHQIRLYPAMESKDAPRWSEVSYVSPFGGADSGPGHAPTATFGDYVRGLGSVGTPDGPVYLVSAEGGGIRAAAWTALVLTRLEQDSGGRFSQHLLAGSGVSGGSLGLALFAALVKARNDGLIATAQMPELARQFLLADYLRGPLETMFLTDLLQRFLPGRLFVDRGQRLENQWEHRWTEVLCSARTPPVAASSSAGELAADCHLFDRPWSDLWRGPGHVPALFLNATDVATGTRFIEEPFARMDRDIPDTEVFAGATVSQDWLPSSAPLSAVVHDSARFTYVSPAGTLQRRVAGPTPTIEERQLVDGGYFENSGLTTLVEVGEVLSRVYPACHADAQRIAAPGCPIRFIHISNDPGVEAMRADLLDACTAPPPAPAHFGEVSAPLIALLKTQAGRGRTARSAAITQYAVDANQASLPTDLRRIYHFRLCEGLHHLPLGWTLSELAWAEMMAQRDGKAGVGADLLNLRQANEIAAGLATPR